MESPTYRQDLFTSLREFRHDYRTEKQREFEIEGKVIHMDNEQLENLIIAIGFQLGYNDENGLAISAV